jgi:hypothetical protein
MATLMCSLMLDVAGNGPFPTPTGCPPPCPTHTHKSGASMSTYKCKLLAHKQQKPGTTWELRAIGVSRGGSAFDIQVKSHYVKKGATDPAKVAYLALDRIICGVDEPTRKRAPRRPIQVVGRRSSHRAAKVVEVGAMKDNVMDGRHNNRRLNTQELKENRSKKRLNSSSKLSFLSLSRHNAFMQGTMKALEQDLEQSQSENASLVRSLSEAVAALQRPDANADAPTQVRSKRMKMAVGSPHTSKKAFNANLDTFHNMGIELVGGNTTRLQELVRSLAQRMNVQPEVVCANPMQVAVYEAAIQYHDQLVDAKGNDTGCWTNWQRICLDNIHNVLALAIQKGARKVPTSQVMVAFSTTRRSLQLATERLINAQKHDLPSALVRMGRAVRDDKLPDDWMKFAIDFWSDEHVSRESEISKRRIRNPYTRKDTTKYGLHFLTVLIKDQYKMMLQAAAKHFKGHFYMSMTINSSLRPFWVKNSTRETCLCIYHLKWMQAAEDLANFRNGLRTSGQCKCTTPILRQSADLWHTLLCPKKEGELCYQWECVNNRCPHCRGAKRLKESVLCKCVGDPRQERIKWKTYDKIDTGKERVAREDGDVSKVYRHDFVPRTEGGSETTPLEDYITYFANDLWPEFIQHHDLALHQDYDWQEQRKNQPRHTCVTVEDFPENLTVSTQLLQLHVC